MILIADSGSTKTDWLLTDEEGSRKSVYKTQGINPFHQDEDTISQILLQELLPQLKAEEAVVDDVFFYGSGVRPELACTMAKALHHALPSASHIEANGDLLGAARGLLGSDAGVACILGTGANSCLYDGQTIIANTPPLGFILGDEGSGAVLGISLINAIYKGRLPQAVIDDFEQFTGMTLADVVDRVYRRPLANRWLASLSPFIHSHLQISEVRQLVINNFSLFLTRNVLPYKCENLPVSFVGSIAWYYIDELKKAVADSGLTWGKVEKSPLEGLAEYHKVFR